MGKGGDGDKWNNAFVFDAHCMTFQNVHLGEIWESGRKWNEIPTSTIELTPKSKFFIYFPKKKGWNFETKIQLKWSIPRMLFCNLGVDLVLPLVGTHHFRVTVRCFKPVDSPKKDVWHPERPGQLVIRNDFWSPKTVQYQQWKMLRFNRTNLPLFDGP